MVLANLVPLIGVLVLGWDAASLLWVYWFELGVMGILNVVKIIQAQLPDVDDQQIQETAKGYRPLSGVLPNYKELIIATQKRLSRERSSAIGCSKFFLSAFFILLYGGFLLLYAGVLRTTFGPPPESWQGLMAANLPLIANHLFSYFFNYIFEGEYRVMTPLSQMFRIFPEILVMHFALFFGAWISWILQAPVFLLAVLVVIKVGVSLAYQRIVRARITRRTMQSLADLR